jgi:hypothetical protein
MSASILLDLCQARTRVLADVHAAWIAEHGQAMPDRNVKEVVREGIELGRNVLRLYDSLWDEGMEEAIGDFQKTGEAVLQLFRQAATTLETIRITAEQANGEVSVLEGKENLSRVLTRLIQIRDAIPDTWPFVTAEMVQEALAEDARGETVPIETLIHEFQNRLQRPGA